MAHSRRRSTSEELVATTWPLTNCASWERSAQGVTRHRGNLKNNSQNRGASRGASRGTGGPRPSGERGQEAGRGQGRGCGRASPLAQMQWEA